MAQGKNKQRFPFTHKVLSLTPSIEKGKEEGEEEGGGGREEGEERNVDQPGLLLLLLLLTRLDSNYSQNNRTTNWPLKPEVEITCLHTRNQCQ